MNAFAGMVSLAGGGDSLFAVEGGNHQVTLCATARRRPPLCLAHCAHCRHFAYPQMCGGLLRESKANVMRGTRVAAIRSSGGRPAYRLSVQEADQTVSVLDYDAVIVATPLQESKIVFDEAVRQKVRCCSWIRGCRARRRIGRPHRGARPRCGSLTVSLLLCPLKIVGGEMQHTHATFVVGRLDARYFGEEEEGPGDACPIAEVRSAPFAPGRRVARRPCRPAHLLPAPLQVLLTKENTSVPFSSLGLYEGCGGRRSVVCSRRRSTLAAAQVA